MYCLFDCFGGYVEKCVERVDVGVVDEYIDMFECCDVCIDEYLCGFGIGNVVCDCDSFVVECFDFGYCGFCFCGIIDIVDCDVCFVLFCVNCSCMVYFC